MSQWKSSVSLGGIVERFNQDEVTLPELVAAVREEFRKNPYYEHPDVRHAAEALADLHLPAETRRAGLGGRERSAFREILGEVESRLQRLERICARDNRIYVSRVLRHFEAGDSAEVNAVNPKRNDSSMNIQSSFYNRTDCKILEKACRQFEARLADSTKANAGDPDAYTLPAGALTSNNFVDLTPSEPAPSEEQTEKAEYSLDFGSTSVGGYELARISVMPQVTFRPKRLVIPLHVAPNFRIIDIKIGMRSQLNRTLPATLSYGLHLKMDTAPTSMLVTICVANKESNSHTFRGCLVGPTVE